ncbi:MAG TPA: hypothetical protein GXX39_07870 [Syntrophothermus lipocalidus]|uniref:Uncharacterized protein n=1 Tax=Syntrophothermus lipocalidus (strain DSM 12680 / TGB-C1) TaxID=643648 RepID=D7CP31_SYNLT|nr:MULTISPECIES: hypothetical protein [Syntrophothermus]ADI02466.1 hypothetical protein Slip_1708 [Syntrophothermus lipocalidus DSM 12680]NSW83540.1 hypothetical protein [Syntrophothermus sp.]HHV77270.1 hypothetical protein [Syntrophothermus lipocalidus]
MKPKPEPLVNIEMCLLAHHEFKILSDKVSYYKALIRERMKFIRHPDITPKEPEPPGEKPDKPSPPERRILNYIPLVTRRKKLEYEKACEEYNHRLKEYYIAYKEYEKACDRYKEALQRWETDREALLTQSQEDIKLARKNLKKASRLLKMYLEVIENSQIHPAYRQPETLEKFKSYLETGRASTVQECINLYETEITWQQLRGSQERMENQLTATIHFIQNDLTRATAQVACIEDASVAPKQGNNDSPILAKLIIRSRGKAPPSVPEFGVNRISHPPKNLIASLRYRVLRLPPL